jgi:hypothetical protein
MKNKIENNIGLFIPIAYSKKDETICHIERIECDQYGDITKLQILPMGFSDSVVVDFYDVEILYYTGVRNYSDNRMIYIGNMVSADENVYEVVFEKGSYCLQSVNSDNSPIPIYKFIEKEIKIEIVGWKYKTLYNLFDDNEE